MRVLRDNSLFAATGALVLVCGLAAPRLDAQPVVSEDIVGAGQTVTHAPPPSAQPALYRARVWLATE
ncbi:MAG: hypothetical protein JXR37_24245 [Kiritimatiellae bacterium]|nr:hypothetical protein [Kiritimatiellia bacterium]